MCLHNLPKLYQVGPGPGRIYARASPWLVAVCSHLIRSVAHGTDVDVCTRHSGPLALPKHEKNVCQSFVLHSPPPKDNTRLELEVVLIRPIEASNQIVDFRDSNREKTVLPRLDVKAAARRERKRICRGRYRGETRGSMDSANQQVSERSEPTTLAVGKLRPEQKGGCCSIRTWSWTARLTGIHVSDETQPVVEIYSDRAIPSVAVRRRSRRGIETEIHVARRRFAFREILSGGRKGNG